MSENKHVNPLTTMHPVCLNSIMLFVRQANLLRQTKRVNTYNQSCPRVYLQTRKPCVRCLDLITVVYYVKQDLVQDYIELTRKQIRITHIDCDCVVCIQVIKK